jgi:nucleotide-binding universal stress UspA family protein
LIIGRAALWVLEHFVGFVYVFEHGLRIGACIDVGVIDPRRFAERLFDFVSRSIPRDAQYFVVVLEFDLPDIRMRSFGIFMSPNMRSRLIYISRGRPDRDKIKATGPVLSRIDCRRKIRMTRRTILFVLNTETPDAQIAQAAEAAAQDGSHLICLALGQAPVLPMYAYGVPPYGGMNIPDNWSEKVTEAQDAQKDRVNAVEALLAKSNASGSVHSAICVATDVKHHVSLLARVSDEAFFAPNLRDTPNAMREAAAGVLFHSPVGLRLNGSVAQKADRVFVAWNSSEAAATAVHAALPYLTEASEVLIACFDPVMTPELDGQDPGVDVAQWLSRHGCTVTVSQFPSGGREIGVAIQAHAKEFGADLIVMGAYGHARMIQTVLGGTTRTMMEQTDLPLLLAH